MNQTTLNETTGDYDIININTQRDVQRPLEVIREFVESYNNLFNEIRSMFMTQRARVPGSRHQFYEPLTTDQRREMSESEIRDWEEQARLGILNRDPMLRQIMDVMRRQMFEPVNLSNGSQIALFEIGITFTREGQMEINEERLRTALENRPDDVTELFTRRASGPGMGVLNESNFNARMADSGISSRIADIIQLYASPHASSGRLIQHAGHPQHVVQSEMLRRIQVMDGNIERMNETLIRRENMHFARFAAMEQAIMRSNQQIEMLWSSLGM